MKIGLIVEWNKVYKEEIYKELLFHSYYEMQLFKIYSGLSGLDLSIIEGDNRKRRRIYLPEKFINLVSVSSHLRGWYLNEILPYPLGLPVLIGKRGKSQFQIEFKFKKSDDLSEFYNRVFKFCKDYKFYYSEFKHPVDSEEILIFKNKL